MSRAQDLQLMWARHSAEWRDCAQVCTGWREAERIEPQLIETKASRNWWGLLEELAITLFVTREYEHLVMALSASRGSPRISFLPLPHPSGLVIDRDTEQMHIASTRNPNQLYTFRPVCGEIERLDNPARPVPERPFVPVSSTFYPGCMYIHDLALINNSLYANAVGHNAIVRLDCAGRFQHIWWPKCIELNGEPFFSRNHIQLNSIAAGSTIRNSFFSASAADVGRLRPGHVRYRVDGRGVIFSGQSREPICEGLTRPHSARLSRGKVWVANSGYGELGFAEDNRLKVIQQLPGWTRGLCIHENVAFVGTSRVIPKFRRYAPGLNAEASRCGIHAVCTTTGKVLASVDWPYGNQIFAIDWISNAATLGFPFAAGRRSKSGEISLFYSYSTETKTPKR